MTSGADSHGEAERLRLIVAHSRLSTLGGGERATLALLDGLSARHDVALWASGYRPAATYPGLISYPRRDLLPPAWLLASPDADVVVAQTFGAGLLALRFPHVVRVVHTLRSQYLAGPLPNPSPARGRGAHGGHRPDLALRRLLDRESMRQAAALVANSAYTAREVERRYGRGAEIIPPGVEPAYFEIPETIGDYALFVGRLAPEKGLERLLAWHQAVDYPLVLVGRGSPAYEARLRGLAGPGVRFAGALTGEALRAMYARARYLTFLPHAEEFGMAALEAMAAGKPVIAAHEGGLPELVANGVTGSLVSSPEEYAMAATRLIGDDALALRLGRAGRERARPYTWDRYAARIEAICRAVAGNAGSENSKH